MAQLDCGSTYVYKDWLIVSKKNSVYLFVPFYYELVGNENFPPFALLEIW